MPDELLHIYTYKCKLCGAQLINDFEYPVSYCPNILKIEDTRCKNNYTITLQEARTNTYNKDMFDVLERTL